MSVEKYVLKIADVPIFFSWVAQIVVLSFVQVFNTAFTRRALGKGLVNDVESVIVNSPDGHATNTHHSQPPRRNFAK